MQNFTNRQKATPFSGYQAGQQTFGPQQTVQTSMGNFPNLQAYQQQQDAFVQQHLKNQAQYNQGLQSGQSPQRVPVMEAWKQAGENIQSGQYQGNPFQTGNVDAIMGMFNQYGIQAPQGFRDQLLQNLGQQSAPPMYQPQRYYYIDPREMSPGGFIQPGPSQPPQPAMGSPELTPGMQVPDSWIVQMPQTNAATAPNVPPGWGVRRLGFGMYSIEAPGQSQADVAAWASQAGASGLSPNMVHGHLRQPQPPTSMQPVAPPAMTYPGGPMQPPAAAPGYGARIRDPGGIFTSQVLDRDGDGIDDRNQLGPSQPFPQAGYPGGPMTPLPSPQPNPSDPWSYPLRPGHTRGPSGEQIMTREAREAEIRRMEQESGRTYVRPKAGVTNGGWLPPAKPKPGASISLSPEQAAAMKQYMDSRQSGRAQPTPARTRGTPYRSGKK